MPQPIRLLHLSDFHCHADTAWDADPVLRALRGFIAAQIKSGLDPDLVVITGDLAQAGKAAEYAAARTWLEALWSMLNQDRSEPLPRNHLLLVPGNHDVDRDRVSGGVRSIQAALFAAQSQKAVAESLQDAGEREFVLKRHGDYLDLLVALINAVRRCAAPITHIAVKNPAIDAAELHGKYIILDLLAEDAAGRRMR